MKRPIAVIALLMLAGAASAQTEGLAAPADPRIAVPPIEYRSAFDGYRAFSEQDLHDWRKSNEEVGMAGGHAGHRPGQGPGKQSSKPQPGKPESSGASGQTPRHEGHGGHK